MTGSRVGSTMKNVFAAWGGQALYAIGSFSVRAVLVAQLAQVYVGLESLFSSILTILSLADLGVGSAIVFALYEPLANDDKETVKSLMRLFKRVYIAIGLVIILLGTLIAPNVEMLLGSDPPDIGYLKIYFLCFVLNTGVSYFFSYKGSLIIADQKSYVVYFVQYSVMILMCVAQIAVLLLTGSYLLFLTCMIGSTLLQNIIIVLVANKRYPYLKEKDVKPVDRQLINDIKKNVAGLMMHKVAGAASTPASNLIITNFVSLAATSLYGNYLLVVNALTNVLSKVFDSVVASVGNLGVLESKERQREVFDTTLFVNAFLFSVVSTGFLCCVNSFIVALFGAEWQFDVVTTSLIVLLFYVKGMRSASLSFTSAYGLYWYTRWKAVLEAVFLPLLALVLVFPLGINGVLLGCIISSLCISSVYEGWAVCRYAIEVPLRSYMLKLGKYMLFSLVVMFSLFVLCEMVPLTSWSGFFVKGLIGVSVSVVLWILVYGRTREWGEVLLILKRVGGKLTNKILSKSREK